MKKRISILLIVLIVVSLLLVQAKTSFSYWSNGWNILLETWSTGQGPEVLEQDWARGRVRLEVYDCREEQHAWVAIMDSDLNVKEIVHVYGNTEGTFTSEVTCSLEEGDLCNLGHDVTGGTLYSKAFFEVSVPEGENTPD